METPSTRRLAKKDGWLHVVAFKDCFSVCVVVYYADTEKVIYNQATKYGPGRFYHIDIILYVYFRIVRVKKEL